MSKCDFCEKPSVGYCSMQCAIYCEDHKKEAEEVEKTMWEACREVTDEKD